MLKMDVEIRGHRRADGSFVKPHTRTVQVAEPSVSTRWAPTMMESLSAVDPIQGHQDVTAREQTVERIAQQELRWETLETRNSDSLDFHDTHVASVRDAMREAYRAGAGHAGTSEGLSDDECDAVNSHIAQEVLSLETLETRNSDSLDFHDMGNSTMHFALQTSWEAGTSRSAQ